MTLHETAHVQQLAAEIAVIGGGLGGVAAALAAAEAGRTVVLTCDQQVLGGQITTQLVPALDEHPHIEAPGGASASYLRLRRLLRAEYGGADNPGGGWVSRLCFEPAAALRVLDALLAPHVAAGRLRIVTGVRPVRAVREDGRLTSVRLGDRDGRELAVAAEVFCDATETGELLPLAGAPWAIGSEGRTAFGESLALPGGPHPHAVQSCTTGLLVEHRPGEDHTVPRPEGYERWRDAQPFTLEIAGWDDRAHRYRMFTDGPDGHPPFWTYRRLREGARFGTTDLALINWAGNDYADASLVHEPERARTESRRLSLAFLHWLQTECLRDDGTGRGYPGLRPVADDACAPGGLAAEPYVRESRRLAPPAPVRQQDLEPVPGAARAANRPDSGGLAFYHMDLHARIGHAQSAYSPTAPFQVPLSALVAGTPRNLLAAAKNLAATQAAAAAYRVHHGEWAVGEAAGTLAAQSLARALDPAELIDERDELTLLQLALVRRGVPLAWLTDLDPADPLFAPAHLLAAAGGLGGARLERLTADPKEPADVPDRAALCAAADRLAPGAGRAADHLPATAPWQDVVTALGAAVERRLPDTRRERPTVPTAAPASRPPLPPGLAGRLVVSCQALPGEPLHGPQYMAQMAVAAHSGGAAAVRINGPADIAAVRMAVPLPVIGLWKDGEDGPYITPTLEHALAVAEAGADVVALDGTGRPRPDGRTLAETIGALHARGVPVMADVATLEEGLAAAAAGADLVSTTLSGYTPDSPDQAGPDLALVRALAERLDVPVVAEGRIATPEEAAAALAAGAHTVVVGGAITRPAALTARFAAALATARTAPEDQP
ncbi:hypothetical protein Kpho02_61830 [Kitasatospora phosalacinea]|uniref:Putative N-acetylmannosamine-6-phosphate 2-epimerase n=1 Tax=Kitasatospora phosalacinea TaxID=2065 RepID=A0A9W6QCF7_9ACTN|nr:hypothetical protein Kpho02_61830 [Kitasatospora phosalacinea]